MCDDIRVDSTPSGISEGEALTSHHENFVVVDRTQAVVLEFEDVLFHHNSAVMLPSAPEGSSSSEGTGGTEEQREISGLDVIRAVYVYAQEHPKMQLVIAGHTDSSGPDRYNFDLSKLRAQAVLYVLIGNKPGWQGVATRKNKVEDYKQILKHVATRYGWDCDPGEVNNTNDATTKQAVKNFQTQYNLEFSQSIGVDGIVGEQTWGAVFDLYMKELAEIMGETSVSGLQHWRDEVEFVDVENRILGCGESIPIDSPGMDGIRSQTNRRIEFVFFDEDAPPPQLTCPPPGDQVHPRETCPLYNDWVNREYINPLQVSELGPQISILELDKWFLPGPLTDHGETCHMKYLLSGRVGYATKVELDIYASNYCDAQVNNDDTITFTAIDDPVSLFHQRQTPENSAPGEDYDLDDWHGQVNVTRGALKPRSGQERFVNVAFSPYTAHMRYFKNDTDRSARIDLLDFWPRWERTDTGERLINDSLKVRWKIAECTKLKLGKIVIVNKGDNIVFEHDLEEGDLSQGEHEYQWNGRQMDNTTITKADMPFRVQVRANSDGTETNGVALAAMHTEVRLYVHPDTGNHAEHEAHQDPNSLKFDLAPQVIATPDEGSAEDAWYQFKLAEAGFHPGPVTGSLNDDTRRALKEFQRSSPKNTAAPFQRLDPEGNKNADTKAALRRLAANARPMFGNPDDLTDFPLADVPDELNNPGHNVVLWVDDRHYYTEAQAGDLFYQRDYHGDMSIGDGRIAKDQAAICRPWIPLQVEARIARKDTSGQGLASRRYRRSRTTSKFVGPLRVDWTFADLPTELAPIDTSHANYQTNRTRSRKYVDETTTAMGDTQDNRTYRNARGSSPSGGGSVDMGGIRPVNNADGSTNSNQYFKQAFGFGDRSLLPWKAADDSNTKSICTLVYDDLQQANDKFHQNYVGLAGAYFNPSRIAGDGYRVQAKVCFEDLPGGSSQFPNRQVLKRRYPQPPKAHSSGLRLWRKTSFRGYVCWAPPALTHWPAHAAPTAEFYRAAHMHFIHENANPTTPRNAFPLGPAGDANALVNQNEYRTIVRRECDRPYSRKTITLNMEYVWPFLTERHYGIPRSGLYPKTAGQRAADKFYDDVLDGMFDKTWRKYRYKLLHLLMKKIEEKHGLLKGHFLVEFKSSPRITINEYECSRAGCDTTRAEVANNAAGHLLTNSRCSRWFCSGRMRLNGTVQYSSIPLPAVGVSMGGTWLFTTGGPDVWAHELGHHRHLQHSRSNPGSSSMAPGGQAAQHDTRVNPALPGATPNKDRCWDRCCIMSYNHSEALYFCGKCLLKNMGWAIEHLSNPAGNLHD